MGCSLAILPNKSQEEQTEMFKSYQRTHESLSFSLMTFRGGKMLIFSNPTLWGKYCQDWVTFRDVVSACDPRRWVFTAKQGRIWSLRPQDVIALLGILLVPFLIFQVLCHPTGRVERWTCSAPGIRTKFHGAFFFSLSVLAQAGSIMGVGRKQRV